MTFDEWYPEMLCETCEREIDSAFADGNEESEHPDECH